jgi:ubiquinone/menaquinone biosynthesis C-methylase UbiE
MTSDQAALTAARDKMTSFWGGVAAEYEANAGGGISAESEHAAWLDILRDLLPPPPSDVLDVGTGPGVMATLCAELGHTVTGIDLAGGMLAVARAKSPLEAPLTSPRFERGDAGDPPFPPASFDVVISRYVVWTMVDPARALANWRRLLRPGGRLIAFDVYWWVREMREDPDFSNYERYLAQRAEYVAMAGMTPPLQGLDSLEEIAQLVREAGFAEVEVRRLKDLELRLEEVMQRVPEELGGPYPIHLITAGV